MEITNPRRFITLLCFLGAAAGVSLYFWRYATADSALTKSGEVVISAGTPAIKVWATLVAEDYTTRTMPWRYQAWRIDAASRLQAGTYKLEKGERISAVISRFVAGDTSPDEFTLTFPEGFTLQQIAERTAARGIGSTEQFMAAAVPSRYVDRFPWLADIPAGRTLEGYLFPDTYQVFADDTPEDVIVRMLGTFDRKVVKASLTKSDARPLDQLVIMASIIEREVLSDDDMALVSGVLWSRSDDGAGLDADATVRYALKKWDEPLTVTDLKSDSPYNTRRWKGLPPGPISNPGVRALAAAAEPEESDFYFYLSTPTGETIFSKTNDEHNQNKAKYL